MSRDNFIGNLVKLSSSLPASLVGRKAAALGRLIEAGFPVPLSVCVTAQAYRQALADSPSHLRLPEGLLDELARLLPMTGPLAVRSSTELEDQPESSLAGRYITYLNVSGAEALEQAILGCWESYRQAHPDSYAESGLAVLIQPLLEGECSGVCFSVDPVRLRPDLLLVVSAWGLGAGVVGGSVPTDTARLRRKDLHAEEHLVADKHTALRPDSSNRGVMAVPVPRELRRIPCLPESWLERVGQFGLAVEQVFAAPQDVEWAVAGGQLWILQSRPITALPAEVRQAARFPLAWEDEEQPRHFWWQFSFMEYPGAALLPVEIDYAKLSHRGGLEAVRFGGGAQTRWIKLTNGRFYMARAASDLEPARQRINGAAWRDLEERLRKQEITLWEFWGPEIVLANARLTAFDGRSADGAALADHLEDTLAAAIRHWMAHTLGSRPIRSATLLDLYARMAGKPPDELAADIPFLISGGESIQTRLIEALYQLAYLAQAAPAAAENAVSRRAFGLPVELPELAEFVALLDQVLETYGSRLCYRKLPGYPAELPLPWREAPDYIWELIAVYLPLACREGHTNPPQARRAALAAAKSRLETLISSAADPTLIEPFRQALAYARRNASGLDDANHHIDQLSGGQFVQALLHAGRWLKEQGFLECEFDIFWLRLDEILKALRGDASSISDLLKVHQAEFAEWQELIPPACLGLPEADLPPREDSALPVAQTSALAHEPPSNTLRGEPASRGLAQGTARRVKVSPALPELEPGDILVAEHIDLHWISILPALTAAVLDYGSPGDHASITAREFGLPVVCATLHATQRIPEGAWVTVDAQTGNVTWEVKP